jgi:hypothetical protein
MFAKPISHKREGVDREFAFRRPSWRCFACSDTGVATNGDSLLGQLFPDYDLLSDGRRLSGVDLPLVCVCAAAHEPPTAGLRGPDGILAQGRAASLTQEQASWLHERRLASWIETERVMNQARMSRAAGDPDAVPWFIAEVRSAVLEQAARHGGAAGRADRAAAAQRRLQPLGGVLADLMASADPTDAPAAAPSDQREAEADSAQASATPALPSAVQNGLGTAGAAG